jgi:DsbC/DsbD-like thiol-disulfide interchange protein
MLGGKCRTAKATILRHIPLSLQDTASGRPLSFNVMAHAMLAVLALLVTLGAAQAQRAPQAATAIPPASITLMDSGQTQNGARMAGLAIALQPEFKTYWRTPGDSGLPPVFDWAKSKNVKQVDVLWPLPHRFDDQAGSSIGYDGEVILPIAARIIDPSQEAVLALTLSFGVCKTICIPVKSDALVRLPPGDRSTSATAAIQQAMAQVPAPAKLDGGSVPGILAAKLVKDGLKPALEVEALVPSGGKIVHLFVEGPDSWLFGASVPAATGPGPAAGVTRIVYRAPLEDAPPGFKAEGTRLTLTLASDKEAIETAGTLDAAGLLH